MDETALYFEVDGLGADENGTPTPAGLVLDGFSPKTVQGVTYELAVQVAARVTGFEAERIHPLSREQYLERYGHLTDDEERTNDDD